MITADRKDQPVRDVCNALLDYAVERDRQLRQTNEADRIDDKPVFIIKRRVRISG